MHTENIWLYCVVQRTKIQVWRERETILEGICYSFTLTFVIMSAGNNWKTQGWDHWSPCARLIAHVFSCRCCTYYSLLFFFDVIFEFFQIITLCADSMIAEVQKKITDAFDIFDHEANKTVDVRYVVLNFFSTFWKKQMWVCVIIVCSLQANYLWPCETGILLYGQIASFVTAKRYHPQLMLELHHHNVKSWAQ